jgi:hypothetical protein
MYCVWKIFTQKNRFKTVPAFKTTGSYAENTLSATFISFAGVVSILLFQIRTELTLKTKPMFLKPKTVIMFTLILGHLAARAQNADFIKLVEYATKAPSGHNTQPWVFRISTSEIEIHPDFSKSLPVADASHRELFISLGCAATNLVIAAAEFGYGTRLSIEKDSISHAFVRVQLFREEGIKSTLFNQIVKRQTNRAIYDGRTIEANVIDSLLTSRPDEGVGIFAFANGSTKFEELSHLVSQGNMLQMSDKAFKKELLDWMRFNKGQINNNPTGLTHVVMGVPPMPGFLARGMVKTALNPKSQNKTDMQKIASSSHFVLFTVSDNSPENAIRLGMSLERFLLETTQLGVAHAYMNQPCQVASIAKKVSHSLGLPNQIPGVILRLGYAEPRPYSVRQEVTAVVEYVD